VPTDLV